MALPKNTPVGFTETFNTSSGFITPRLTPSKTSVTLYPAGFCIPRCDNLAVTRDGIAPAELNTTKAQLPSGSIGLVQNWICPNWNKQWINRNSKTNIETVKNYWLSIHSSNTIWLLYSIDWSSWGQVHCKDTYTVTHEDRAVHSDI